jgi:hypothetical protein
VFAAWPGSQLGLVTDAREHLFSLFSNDLERVHQAVWSNSVFLSCLAHNHLAAELAEGPAEAMRGKSISLLSIKPPGLSELVSAYGNQPLKEAAK